MTLSLTKARNALLTSLFADTAEPKNHFFSGVFTKNDFFSADFSQVDSSVQFSDDP